MKRYSLKDSSTNRSNSKGYKCFAAYFEAKKLPTEYWLMDEPELDQILSKFWFEGRTTEGKHYKIASLESPRYGLNRILHEKGHKFDIVHGPSFSKSRKCLKSKGYGVRISCKEIKPKGN